MGRRVICCLQQEQSAATILVVSHSLAASQFRPTAAEYVSGRPAWEHTQSVKPTFPKYIALYIPDAFTEVRKATTSFVICLSVCQHETTRFPLDGFSLNFIFNNFSKICLEN